MVHHHHPTCMWKKLSKKQFGYRGWFLQDICAVFLSICARMLLCIDKTLYNVIAIVYIITSGLFLYIHPERFIYSFMYVHICKGTRHKNVEVSHTYSKYNVYIVFQDTNKCYTSLFPLLKYEEWGEPLFFIYFLSTGQFSRQASGEPDRFCWGAGDTKECEGLFVFRMTKTEKETVRDV